MTDHKSDCAVLKPIVNQESPRRTHRRPGSLVERVKMKTPEERFHEKVMPEPMSGCWLWLGSLSGRYGALSINGRLVRAHRFSYEIYRGAIPAKMNILHKCDVPSCVNPSHLFLGTHADNMRDMVRKGRHVLQKHPEKSALIGSKGPPYGEGHPGARLSNQDVKDIASSSQPTIYLASFYQVHRTTIQRIRNGQRRISTDHISKEAWV